jgi:hypothetical protein
MRDLIALKVISASVEDGDFKVLNGVWLTTYPCEDVSR